MKFHIIALAIICIVITALYMLIGPGSKPAKKPNEGGDFAIEIYSATWGLECNPYIQDANSQPKPVEKDENGMPVVQHPLKLVEPNNVLEVVGNACNGQIRCDITPTAQTLGVDPMPSCAKTLNLSYRCYSYDRLWNVSIGQGVTTTVDCNEAARKTTGADPKASAPAGK